tara:strand:- start:3920 stop:4342 length:423 start_codon:yes stop_codon:yes gene_type:complete
MKTFEPDKSNLSAYQLETFKEAASLRTPVSSIPGVGEITSKHFKEKFDLYTIGDVLNKISSYQDLIKILPKYVNSHRIYEALLKTFPDDLNNALTIQEQKEDRSRVDENETDTTCVTYILNKDSTYVENELEKVSECLVA